MIFVNVLYVVNKDKDIGLIYSKEIVEYLKTKDINIYCIDECLLSLNLNLIVDFSIIDLVIVLGGDGTILKYSRCYGKYNIPILGINLGRVGALAIARISNYKELIDKFLVGNYFITDNLTLQGKIRYKNQEEVDFVIYNDVMIHRGISVKLLPIFIGINNTRFDKIYADGIVISSIMSHYIRWTLNFDSIKISITNYITFFIPRQCVCCFSYIFKRM